jgi:hypothetical protein
MSSAIAIVAVVLCFGGIIWATVGIERYRREIRIYRQIKADPLIDLHVPRWLIELYNSTLR